MIHIGIPARMGSSRFPGKPLALIHNKPMIHWVYDHCMKAHIPGANVFIATPDKEIEDYCQLNKINYIHTEQNIPRPCLRVMKAIEYNMLPSDLLIVVQGDEPTISSQDIEKFVTNSLDTYLRNTISIYNAYSETDPTDAIDPNEIKVVIVNSQAIYFSRNVIPSNHHSEVKPIYYKQVCIFGYNENAIGFMMRSQPQMLEKIESIEMLRPIEHGIQPIMIPIHTLNHSVDVESDILIVEKILKDRGEA